MCVRYESIVRVHLVPYFGDRPISDITTLDIEEFKAHNRKMKSLNGREPDFLKPKTINEHLGALSCMFNKAIDWGYLKENPCSKARRLKVPEVELAWYTEEETALFLAACKRRDPTFYGIFLVGFRTGMRLGELLALQWSDLDLETRLIKVLHSYRRGHVGPRKNGKMVPVPMHPDVVDFLDAVPGEKRGLVFHNGDGKHLTRDMLKRPYDRSWKAAGLHRTTIHGMRHSFISQLVKRRVPMAAISKLAGHSETKITARYAHVRPSDQQNYVNLLAPLHESPTTNVVELESARQVKMSKKRGG